MLAKITRGSQVTKLLKLLEDWEFREGCHVKLQITNLFVDVHIYEGATVHFDRETNFEILSIVEFGNGNIFNKDSLLEIEAELSHGYHTIDVVLETVDGINKLTVI